MTDYRVYDLIDTRQRKGVFRASIIKIGIIHTYLPLVILFWNYNHVGEPFQVLELLTEVRPLVVYPIPALSPLAEPDGTASTFTGLAYNCLANSADARPIQAKLLACRHETKQKHRRTHKGETM